MKHNIEKFSVILPIYSGTEEKHFKNAFDSILQSNLLPKEVIIILDGQIAFDVTKNLNNKHYPINIKIKQIAKNVGAGFARNAGIKLSTSPIIALMDADDICRDDRFSKQFDYVKNKGFDVVGGFIEEFYSIPGDLKKIRRVPEYTKDIIKFAKFRQPFNNVTLMFKKSIFNRVQGYKISRYVEDYDLIYRIILSGCKLYNIQGTLVDVRLGEDYLLRRAGLKYFFAEQKLIFFMYKSNFLNIFEFILNVFLRGFFRLFQSKILFKLHNWITRSAPIKQK